MDDRAIIGISILVLFVVYVIVAEVLIIRWLKHRKAKRTHDRINKLP